MSDDLVKRLRCDELWPLDWDDAIAWCRKAADRIEQLEAHIKKVEAAHFISCKDGVSNMEDIENQEKRIEQLEAANLKASLIKVDDMARIEKLQAELHHCFHRIEELQAALREIAGKGNATGCNPQMMCNTARKALEGKDD
jgi:uncharacterized protein YhaN